MSQIEQDHGEVLVANNAGAEPIKQERPAPVARGDALDLILLALAPALAPSAEHGCRILLHLVDDLVPLDLALRMSLQRRGDHCELFRREGHGLWKLIGQEFVRERTEQF